MKFSDGLVCRNSEGAELNNKYLLLSDIHGNVSALDAVWKDCGEEDFTGIILLGDCIDYGMRSNEVIQKLVDLSFHAWKDRMIVNIWGNHEKLLFDRDLERLSSDRGRVMAKYTAKQISKQSLDYICTDMRQEGICEFEIDGMRCLALHGSLNDCYWEAIEPENVRGDYAGYDFVFSGHSHCSHVFTKFYPTGDSKLRYRKAVTFINPGSVGQPRNQNPNSQYAVLTLPSKQVELRTVGYDIEYEQSLFPAEIDAFYKNRLTLGI